MSDTTTETSKLHNYKSLFEEIAQTDNNYLLDDTTTYSNSKYFNSKCYCCKLNSAAKSNKTSYENNISINEGVFNFNYEKMPVYSSIWIHEMRNATDYLEYLNRIRRNSTHSVGNNNSVNSKSNNSQANYYQISVTDFSLQPDNDSFTSGSAKDSNNFLKVPKFFDDDQRRTPELEDIATKISEINQLDNSVSALIYKSIEVHADILSLDATVSRLLAETRKILEELEDVKCLDEIIDMLNSDIGPIIHREWKYPISNANYLPVEEGIPVA